jgi:predicted HAD superfamily Cof-like phosphohydrolase
MSDLEAMVRAFHSAFYQVVADSPAIPDVETVQLRKMLIAEEYCELQDALEENNLVHIADGIADLVYVTIGAAVTYGIPFNRVFAEVHRANMRKAINGVTYHQNGKVQKPPGWEGPDIAGVMLGGLQ